VRSLLQDVVRRIDPELLDGIEPNEERAALALIQTSFRQAIDLIENPACAADRSPRRSAHEFADRARRRSSMDGNGGGGLPRRTRLRADRGLFTLAFNYLGAESALDCEGASHHNEEGDDDAGQHQPAQTRDPSHELG